MINKNIPKKLHQKYCKKCNINCKKYNNKLWYFCIKKLMITNQSKICDKTILKTYKSKKETKIISVKSYENKCDKICEKNNKTCGKK